LAQSAPKLPDAVVATGDLAFIAGWIGLAIGAVQTD